MLGCSKQHIKKVPIYIKMRENRLKWTRVDKWQSITTLVRNVESIGMEDVRVEELKKQRVNVIKKSN